LLRSFRQFRQNLFSSRTPEGFVALTAFFFLLYALTAQRGTGWGDSAEFQSWALGCRDWICGPHFSNAHPLYVWFCRLVARTPYEVTLVSSFFGAVSVGGFYLSSGRFGLSLVFGLSHMLWWNSSLAEVQTMSLAFTAFETLCILSFLRSGHWIWFFALAFLNGLHLEVHNFALLALPVYTAVFFRRARGRAVGLCVPLALVWAVGASGWLSAAVTRGLPDVLFGAYGAKVAGILPTNLTLAAFNFALSGLSFFAPVALVWWNRHSLATLRPTGATAVLWGLFAVNALFFVRYFVPDQATFLLPTLFYAFLLVSRLDCARVRLLSLLAMQILLPVMAWQVLAAQTLPEWKTRHEGRNDAAYFALPWKVGVAK